MMRNKLFIYFSLTAIAFILLTAIDFIRLNWLTISLISILLFSVLFLAVNQLIIKRIVKIASQLKKLDVKNPGIVHLTREGNDEINTIVSQINQMVNAFQTKYENNEKKHVTYTSELQTRALQLQKELLSYQSNEKKQVTSHECLSQLARYDALTSLPNRIFFNEILNKSLSHAKRRDKIMALLYINLDDFKNVNTNLGTAAGDSILKEISVRLTGVLRAEDILAKLEGDEFILLLNDISKPKFASTVAEKILKAISAPIKFDNQEIKVTTSIGICIYPTDGTSLEVLLKNLDLALQKAKQSGKKSYQFYSQSMDIEAHEYIQLEGALRKALQNNELAIYFQPKLNLKKGSLVGTEALIRWTHPELGIINPAKFIPLAEETNMIMQIGEWALREACRINKYWQDEGFEHLSIAVNLSPKQFMHPQIISVINDALKTSGLNPNYLELEISEETIMQDIEAATRKLEDIKALGVELTMDHFGAGYTSISHLKNLPISSIKIDRNFIAGIPLKPSDLAITSAIIALAHNLGLLVIAEGVETAEQVQHLANQNCDIIQGYFLSHPQPAQKIILQFRKLMDGAII